MVELLLPEITGDLVERIYFQDDFLCIAQQNQKSDREKK